MRIATFNIHHGTVGTDGRVDPDRLGEVCAGLDADVLALQEVDLGTYRTGRADLAAVVARACGMTHAFGRSVWFPGGAYGNALLVRGELQDPRVIRLPKVPGWHRWQERRTVLAASITAAGQPWSVLATHLAVPQDVNGPQLDRVLELARQQPHPALVLGDLNRGADGVRAGALAAGLSLVEHGATYPALVPRAGIDHVLVPTGTRVGAVEVRSTPMSDHAALLVDIDVG